MTTPLRRRQQAIIDAFTAEEEDAITDAIADEVVERIERFHPHADDALRERLVRLYTAQATGAAPPPGRITGEQLAAWLGISSRSLSAIASAALARMWKIIETKYPELKHEIRSTKS